MNYQAPVKIVPDVPNAKLEDTIKELENQSYMITQRKRVERWNWKTQSTEVFWTLKAKLNAPQPKAGRIIVDG